MNKTNILAIVRHQWITAAAMATLACVISFGDTRDFEFGDTGEFEKNSEIFIKLCKDPEENTGDIEALLNASPKITYENTGK